MRDRQPYYEDLEPLEFYEDFYLGSIKKKKGKSHSLLDKKELEELYGVCC